LFGDGADRFDGRLVRGGRRRRIWDGVGSEGGELLVDGSEGRLRFAEGLVAEDGTEGAAEGVVVGLGGGTADAVGWFDIRDRGYIS
jgi:hypothetical protein